MRSINAPAPSIHDWSNFEAELPFHYSSLARLSQSCPLRVFASYCSLPFLDLFPFLNHISLEAPSDISYWHKIESEDLLQEKKAKKLPQLLPNCSPTMCLTHFLCSMCQSYSCRLSHLFSCLFSLSLMDCEQIEGRTVFLSSASISPAPRTRLDHGGGGLVTKSYPIGTPWTLVHRAPLSMGFPRQEYWSLAHSSCLINIFNEE